MDILEGGPFARLCRVVRGWPSSNNSFEMFQIPRQLGILLQLSFGGLFSRQNFIVLHLVGGVVVVTVVMGMGGGGGGRVMWGGVVVIVVMGVGGGGGGR
eukprot:7748223-Heterocapsa_arctica.AAC.1